MGYELSRDEKSSDELSDNELSDNELSKGKFKHQLQTHAIVFYSISGEVLKDGLNLSFFLFSLIVLLRLLFGLQQEPITKKCPAWNPCPWR